VVWGFSLVLPNAPELYYKDPGNLGTSFAVGNLLMTKLIHQPHDKLFKVAMKDLRVAREFFESHLPADILKQVNLDTLKLEKHSFIDDVYKSTEADVVYSIKQGENTGYFYLLCENQSEVDKMIAFRLLVSKVRLMEQHHKQNPHSPLPLVYSMVVYTGEKLWDAPMDIVDLMAEPKALAQQVFSEPYQLIDVQRMSDDEIRQRSWSGLVEFALKYRRARKRSDYFFEIVLPWLDKKTQEDGFNLCKIVLTYTLDDLDTDYDAERFKQKVTQYLTSELRGEAMTLAQQFREQGIQEGIQQGIQQTMTLAQQFRAEGVQKGESVLLLRQLQCKFGSIPDRYRQKTLEASEETLLTWGERLVEAQTLEEIFAEIELDSE
jgi:predicted transposase/invertase (TIGR01784 family)